MSSPRITFGIIVLNGEPFTRYNLRSLYPFAHQIIVAEGASPKAKSIATPDGHSVDGTLDLLRRFKKEEDPDGKLIIVTAEDAGHPNGFWPGEKDEQSQAYALRATGDYLWQIDIDEFYKPEDIERIISMLDRNPTISQISVPQLNFWGGFEYLVDGLFLSRFYYELGNGVPRIFRWGHGYQYVTHRPATVQDPKGEDLRNGNWVHGDRLKSQGIYCYHYATLFPDSVGKKMRYYLQHGWDGLEDLDKWFTSNFSCLTQPFRIHHATEEISWLSRYKGTHPPEIQKLISDIRRGALPVRVRARNDIEHLLASKTYILGTICLSLLAPLLLSLRTRHYRWERRLERLLEKLFGWPLRRQLRTYKRGQETRSSSLTNGRSR
jgi:hypothetical protein